MSDPVVSFTAPIVPEGKRAHNSRVVFKHGRPFVMHYPDTATVAYEEALASYARIAMMGIPILRGEAVSIAIEAYMPVPVSWTKTHRADALANRIGHLSKPDWDNIAKSACDALKGIVWDDDSRVVMGQVQKYFSDDPRLRITVWRWFEDEPKAPEQTQMWGDFD